MASLPQAVLRESPGYRSGGTAPKGNVRALGSAGAHAACVSWEAGVTHDRDLLREPQSAWEEKPRPSQEKEGIEQRAWGREQCKGPEVKIFLACLERAEGRGDRPDGVGPFGHRENSASYPE